MARPRWTTSWLWASAILAVVPSATAFELKPRSEDETPKVFHVPIQRRATELPVASPALQRRAKDVGVSLTNFQVGSLYFANISIGTPGQAIRAHLDTGSSDLWVNVANSKLCQELANASPQDLLQTGNVSCAASGTYNANNSHTYQYINSNFEIDYADQSGASGDLASDNIGLGGVTINGQTFGIGYHSTSPEAVMGIGYKALEAETQKDNSQPYNNIPQTLVQQGYINAAAYSLWLDDLSSSTGSILFGGVDTSKFFPPLQPLGIVSEGRNQYVEAVVDLSSVSMTVNGQNTTIVSSAFPVLLDSGSTLSYLPNSAIRSLYSAVGAQYDSQDQVGLCPCGLANSTASVNFVFGGVTISVPMSELVLTSSTSTSSSTGTGPADSDSACIFGIVPLSSTDSSSGATYTLGDTFLRAAYVVYNLESNEIALAQTNFNPQGSNVQEIQSGSSANIPAATTPVASPTVTLSGQATGILGPGGVGQHSSSTKSSKAYAAPTPAPASGAIVGAGVAALLAVAAI